MFKNQPISSSTIVLTTHLDDFNWVDITMKLPSNQHLKSESKKTLSLITFGESDHLNFKSMVKISRMRLRI